MEKSITFCETEWKQSTMLVAGLLGIFGLLAFYNHAVTFGLILMAFSIFLALFRYGYEIDGKRLKWRYVRSFLGWKSGDWQSLENLDYISVVGVVRGSNLRVPTIMGAMNISDNKHRGTCYLQFVFVNSRKPERIFMYDSEEGVEKALAIGNYLDVEVYDCTTPNKQWIRTKTN
ncbi:MAG: hypothetical protein H6607_11125 [Flavobacteriales bacterium]|nr:hypothetical protein [Flavobacteriales bacterium]